ncbi:MAG: hypothetical protein WC675_05255 [Patescibacteria group bacterium]|jgi:hypothetical protein
MYTYRQIFKQAFKVAWQTPSIWFFGFFAVFLGGDIIFSSYNFGVDQILFAFLDGLQAGGLFSLSGLSGALKVFFAHPLFLFLIILIFLVLLGFVVVTVWLALVSQSALISQVVSVTKSKRLSWRAGFNFGLIKFWPVLGLNVFLRIITWSLTGIIFLLSAIKFPGYLLLFIILFDIILVIELVVSFIGRYAICGVVLRDWSLKESIPLALEIFKKNWLLSLEIAIILFLISFLVNGLLFIILPFILLTFLGVYAGFTFGLILLFLALLVIFLFVEIILVTFRWGSWVLVFELIAGRKLAMSSLLQRIFS